jgi:hypothetical protein
MKIKRLTSPVKEPYWEYDAAGLDEKHFKGFDVVRFECSYKNKSGEKIYPRLYEIKSDVALTMCRRDQKNPALILVPFDQCSIAEELMGEKEAPKQPGIRPARPTQGSLFRTDQHGDIIL